MSTTVEQIRSELMGLSASERASLAHDLILSVVREGMAEGRPADSVFADIKAKYR